MFQGRRKEAWIAAARSLLALAVLFEVDLSAEQIGGIMVALESILALAIGQEFQRERRRRALSRRNLQAGQDEIV